MKFRNTFFVWLAVAITIALIIRLPAFGDLPRGLNRDETALGYTAFSLANFGIDEWGNRWPVSIFSFGDQKLPGYVYTLIPFVKIFGLSEVTTKLPSFLSGLALIPLVGLITQELTRKLKNFPQSETSGLVMILIAASPWANHFSRIAYEAHLALAFFTLGFWSFLVMLRKTQKQQRLWLLLTAFSWSLALMTYHSYHLLIPLIISGIVFIFNKKILTFEKAGLIGGITIGFISLAILFFGGVWSANQNKLQGINPFNPKIINPQYVELRTTLPEGSIIGKLFANRFTEYVATFSNNVIAEFDPRFYLISGGGNKAHNVDGIGNFQPLLLPFFLLGLYTFLQLPASNTKKLFLVWIAASLIAPALTISPQHTVRLSPLFPTIEILSALGVITFLSFFAQKRRLLATLILGSLFAYTTARFVMRYHFISPVKDAQYSDEKYHVLAQALTKYKGQYQTLYTPSPASSPYIWYLFENRYNPEQLILNRQAYPATDEGFVHIHQIDNIIFEDVDWGDVESASTGAVLFITPPEKVPGDKKSSPDYKLIETLSTSTNEKAWELWQLGQ